MMQIYRIQRDSWTVLAGILHANEPFEANSMRGELNVSPSQAQMPYDEYVLMLGRADTNEGVLDYAVYSYETIIGYRIGDQWYVPHAKYSKTTTNQQTKLRLAVNN